MLVMRVIQINNKQSVYKSKQLVFIIPSNFTVKDVSQMPRLFSPACIFQTHPNSEYYLFRNHDDFNST